MADFTPIETQEAFDAAVTARLEEHTRTVTAAVEQRFAGWVSPEQQKTLTDEIDTLKASVANLTAKNKAHEIGSIRQRIAHEKGIPFELADRLAGDTEEAIAADAEKLVRFTQAVQSPAPKYSREKPPAGDTSDAALRAMLSELSM